MDVHGLVAALYVCAVLVTAVPLCIVGVAAYRILGGNR